MNVSEIKPESVPSIDLSFDWLKDVLYRQSAEVATLDNKTVALFTLGTAIITLDLGIPLGTSNLSVNTFLTSPFGWLSLIVFLILTGLAVAALWAREYVSMDNPKVIRESYWELTPFQFKINLLLHTEEAHEQNRSKLILKGKLIRFMVPVVALEAIFLVLLFVVSF